MRPNPLSAKGGGRSVKRRGATRFGLPFRALAFQPGDSLGELIEPAIYPAEAVVDVALQAIEKRKDQGRQRNAHSQDTSQDGNYGELSHSNESLTYPAARHRPAALHTPVSCSRAVPVHSELVNRLLTDSPR